MRLRFSSRVRASAVSSRCAARAPVPSLCKAAAFSLSDCPAFRKAFRRPFRVNPDVTLITVRTCAYWTHTAHKTSTGDKLKCTKPSARDGEAAALPVELLEVRLDLGEVLLRLDQDGLDENLDIVIDAETHLDGVEALRDVDLVREALGRGHQRLGQDLGLVDNVPDEIDLDGAWVGEVALGHAVDVAGHLSEAGELERGLGRHCIEG